MLCTKRKWNHQTSIPLTGHQTNIRGNRVSPNQPFNTSHPSQIMLNFAMIANFFSHNLRSRNIMTDQNDLRQTGSRHCKMINKITHLRLRITLERYPALLLDRALKTMSWNHSKQSSSRIFTIKTGNH